MKLISLSASVVLASLAFDTVASAQDAATNPDTIVVIGTRTARPIKDSPVVVRVVDQREIEASGDSTAADALTRVAGVNVDTSLRTGQTPQIQGFASKHVLVLIDGRPANGRLTDDFDLSRIPASSIERIEVLKGSSSVLYGSDAIGGVVNIVTKKPRAGLHGSARAQRDSLHRSEGQLSITGGSEHASARLSVNHQKAPSFDLDKSDIATTGNASERNHVQLELGATPSESLDLAAVLAGDEAVANGVSLGAANSVIDLGTKGVGRSGRLTTRYRPSPSGEVRLDLGGSRRSYELRDDQRGGTAADRRLDSTEATRDAALVASVGYLESQETTLGVETSDQELRYNQIGDEAKDRQRTSAFVQHQWRPVDALTLVPGARFDRDTQFEEHVSKAFTARIDPAPSTSVRLSYGEGYRAPSFSELYLSFANAARGYRVEGNEELSPETSKSYQTNVTWQPTRDLWLSLGGFDSRVKDLIINVRTGVMPNLLVRYANVDSVRNRGIEASSRARVAERWIFGLDYMFLEARDEQRHRTLDGRAMHSGAVQARYDWPASGLNAAFTMNLVGKRPYYTENAGTVTTKWSEAHRAANVRLAQTFGGHFEVFGGARNLTNEGQELYNPVAPRSYFGGVGAEL